MAEFEHEYEQYLPQNFVETNEYSRRLWRGGLSDLPPAIVTCAITGSNAGKEVNPNLPETLEEQVQACVEAYEAGASMVHIHRRNPNNPCEMTMSPEVRTLQRNWLRPLPHQSPCHPDVLKRNDQFREE